MSARGGASTPCLIQDVFVTKRFGAPGTLSGRSTSILIHGKQTVEQNMMFAGYGTNALTDYMFYPATSDSRRTIEFDLDCGAIDNNTHLSVQASFLMLQLLTAA